MNPDGKRQRHRHILDVLARNRVHSQDELQDLLLAEGVETTQSTLSRDLRELGIVKGHAGYRPPARDTPRSSDVGSLAMSLGRHLASVESGGNLVVLRTTADAEPPEMAARIERARLHLVAAALVCDNAVLVITRSQAYAREFTATLRKHLRRNRRSR